MSTTANSFKFSTVLWMIAGLLIPFWPISLPLCWFFAYRSYRSGGAPRGSLQDLHTAAELHRSGAISDTDFEKIKAKTLGSN